jgi:hypothetical protein
MGEGSTVVLAPMGLDPAPLSDGDAAPHVSLPPVDHEAFLDGGTDFAALKDPEVGAAFWELLTAMMPAAKEPVLQAVAAGDADANTPDDDDHEEEEG